MKLSGTVWKLPGQVGATDLVPARFDDAGVNDQWEECARHLLEDVDPSLAGALKRGDIIVAGTQLGTGHAHYYRAAIMTCKFAGVGALLSDSVKELFQRASIDQGLVAWPYPGICALVSSGDHLELDLESGHALNRTTGGTANFRPLSPIVLDILRAGGSFPLALQRALPGGPADRAPASSL